MKEEIIQYKGLDELDEFEKAELNKFSERYFPKIKRETKNLTSVELHIKIHRKEFKKDEQRKKYSIHLRVIAPTKIFEASADDWDFPTAVHKAYENAILEIKKHFRSDISRRKSYD